ncbi:MAG: hypothetical protein J6R20_08575 [Clostridia bacterium]|nr:hypothetical protein [Clostridia bacterium]
MKIKRIISVLLALAMLFSVTATAFASADESGYVADYDTETPVIIVHGMSQNNTYLVDDNGEWVPDETGYVTGWPLEIDVMPLIKRALPNMLLSILTRKDVGLTEAMYEGTYNALSLIEKDNDGKYINNIEVPCYEMPMSELPEDVKEEYYTFLPIQELSEIVGEDDVYYFGYDSLGDVMYETEKLHHYIHDVVLPKSPNGQVKLCHISLGGTIAINYLETYPEDYELIKKMVFVIPAIDGSDIIGDLFTGNLSVFYDDNTLYEDLFVTLLGETPLAYVLNMVLRILPTDVLKSALGGLANGLVDIAALRSTMIWALCPDAYYEEAKGLWLEGNEDLAGILEDVEYFMNARANFEDNLFALRETGCEIFNLACYDVNLFPLCKNYKTKNADRVIHAASPAMGATFADLGETLGEGYEAVGTYCDNPDHNHLSPDGVVDATTGLLPCTTWYFKAQAHEQLPENDVALGLAIRVMADNNMKDVYSNPAYPQFNEGRLTFNARDNIEAWNEADKSKLTTEEIDTITTAVEKVEALLGETIVNQAAWKAADAELEKALADAKIIEDESPTKVENVLTVILRTLNRGVNKILAAE